MPDLMSSGAPVLPLPVQPPWPNTQSTMELGGGGWQLAYAASVTCTSLGVHVGHQEDAHGLFPPLNNPH